MADYSDALGSGLRRLVMCEHIEPGDKAGYEMCKTLWEQPPLGGKLVEKPIKMALFKPRLNNLDDDPDDKIVNAFNDVWTALGITEKIKNLFFVNRCYGAAAIGIGTRSRDSDSPLPDFGLALDDVFINVWDPLNASGSMMTNQDPNSPDYQQAADYLTIGGRRWHPSRTVKIFNGAPIYLGYQSSTFGYTGRSVFQRALYPLKSYLQSMVTDDLVSRKAGILVARTAQNSPLISNLMGIANRFKRGLIKEAENGSVLNIGPQDAIESLNLQNIDGAMKTARDNIVANIAAASDTPAIVLKEEAFANGFGEGKEDAKAVSQYIDSVRQEIQPVIVFFERIVQYIAWSEDFYHALRREYPDLVQGNYQDAFLRWRHAFRGQWPDLTKTSPEDQRKSDSDIMKSTVEYVTAIAPMIDIPNRARLIEWSNEMINRLETARDSPLVFDYDQLEENAPPIQVMHNGKEAEEDIL